MIKYVITRFVLSAFITATPDTLSSSTSTVSPGSFPRNSLSHVAFNSATEAFTLSASSFATRISALHSLEMTLFFVPPAMLIRRMSVSKDTWFRSLPIILCPFPRCLWISAPECPPRSPWIRILIFSPSAFSRVTGISVLYPNPPAQPTVTIPSSSESILISFFPLSTDKSIFSAPPIPISSSTVNTASIGGCGISLLSKIASAIATAIPSSPPSVVSFAFTYPSSTYSSSGSFLKSWFDSGRFSHTISICPWIMTGSLFSYPTVPGLEMIMLFVSSCMHASPLSFANATQ